MFRFLVCFLGWSSGPLVMDSHIACPIYNSLESPPHYSPIAALSAHSVLQLDSTAASWKPWPIRGNYWAKCRASMLSSSPFIFYFGVFMFFAKYLPFSTIKPSLCEDRQGAIKNGGPPADLLINQGVWDNVSGHTTRAPPGRVRTDNQTVPALCHGH